MVCKNCGANVKKGRMFCKKCGANVQTGLVPTASVLEPVIKKHRKHNIIKITVIAATVILVVVIIVFFWKTFGA
jgi:uncharacterized membrane protein YvbJ